jgi:hypothetical protein
MRSFLTRTLALSLVGTAAIAPSAFSFDLEDYATTYRATRDAYLKAEDELDHVVGIYSRMRKAAELIGFDIAAGEQYFWPLDLYRPKIQNESGQPCLDSVGNPRDNFCNAGATCTPETGTCTDWNSPFANVSEPKKLLANYAKFIAVKDQVARTDRGSQFEEYFIHPDQGWESIFGWPFREARDAAIRAYVERLSDLPDLYAQPEGTEFAGLIVPKNYLTAQWQLDPVADQALIEAIRGQYAAVRDSLLKAVNELRLALGPYRAASEAYRVATEIYTYSTTCGAFERGQLPAEWFCISRPDGSARCDCNLGPDQCTTNVAVIANEPLPSQSFELCPAAPSAEFPCLCVVDAAGRPCQSGTGTRTYE